MKWIRLDRKLPERNERVLVTLRGGTVFLAKYTIMEYSDTQFWNVNGQMLSDREVLAWMPLPEPYGEKRQ